MATIVFVFDFLIFFDLDDELHAATGEVENQVAQVHVDDSGKVIPIKCLGVVHEEEGNQNGKGKKN